MTDRPRPELDLTSLEHKPGCTGEAITRHNGTRFAQLTCQGCGANAVVPRDTDRWQR